MTPLQPTGPGHTNIHKRTHNRPRHHAAPAIPQSLQKPTPAAETLPTPTPVPDQRRIIAQSLAEQFPGIHAWYGQHTHHWWALVEAKGWRNAQLVEATTPGELHQAIANATEQA